MQVSWVRHRDIHLLTVGRYTYTSDQRFRAIHLPHSEDWTLQVKYYFLLFHLHNGFITNEELLGFIRFIMLSLKYLLLISKIN